MQKEFTAEIGKVLRLVIHSIYTNKEIFLRELISNASDACDKLRYHLLSNPASGGDQQLQISVSIDKDSSTLFVKDSGIGMDENDLIQNLGTIASSGTQRFLEQYSGNSKDLELIGQFGVGFYAAFMVAELVTVYSRKAGQDKTFVWESDGKDCYTVRQATKDEEVVQGTTIKLKLMLEYSEFLEKHRIQHIIKIYSDHIAFPIELIDADGNTQVVNSSSALWQCSPSEVSQSQYEDFYHQLSYMPDKPWMTLHNRVEGNLTYTNLLFIPSQKPFDLFSPERKSRVKLYIKRVFITDEGINIIPSYLRFLSGVIDSEDLPLNISRETLQDNVTISKIRKSIIKRILSVLQKKTEDNIQEFESFWASFGEVLKEGLCEGASETKESLLELCRFNSLKYPNKTINLATYVAEMVEGQNEIYYLIGPNKTLLAENPQLQGFKKRDIDVLLFTDHVDDFWVNVVPQYKNYELKSIMSAGLDLNKIHNVAQDGATPTSSEATLLAHIKSVLSDRVKDVQISTKLVDSPVCLVIPEGAMNIRMERMLIEQKQLSKKSHKILEINIKHRLWHKVAAYMEGDVQKSEELISILFNQACILEGENIDNPYEFVESLNKFL